MKKKNKEKTISLPHVRRNPGEAQNGSRPCREVMVHFLTHHHGRRLVAALKVAAGPGPPRGGEGGKSKPPHAVQRRCNDVRMCSRSGTPKIQIIKISPLSSAFAAKMDYSGSGWEASSSSHRSGNVPICGNTMNGQANGCLSKKFWDDHFLFGLACGSQIEGWSFCHSV